MRMYPKEIRSLKQLEQEKKRLNKQLEELDEQEIFSMSSLMGRSEKKKGAKEDDDEGGIDLTSIISLLPISSPILKTVLPLVQSRIMAMMQRKAPQPVAQAATAADATTQTTGQKVKHAALAVGKDVVIGYLKWKAIELTFKGVRHLVNKQREKKQAASN